MNSELEPQQPALGGLITDIDTLFEQLAGDLGHDLDEELEWIFLFRADSSEGLRRLAASLQDDFDTELQAEIEEDGSETIVLGASQHAALSSDDVKAMAAQMNKLATTYQVQYEGVECFEPPTIEEIYGWLDLKAACWRLQHLSEGGLAPDAEMPWTFLISTTNFQAVQSIAQSLTELNWGSVQSYDEPDEEGYFGAAVFMTGPNSEAALQRAFSQIEQLATSHGGTLEGVQFLGEEELDETDGTE